MSFGIHFAYFAVQFPLKNQPIRVSSVFHLWLLQSPGLYLRRDRQADQHIRASRGRSFLSNVICFTRTAWKVGYGRLAPPNWSRQAAQSPIPWGAAGALFVAQRVRGWWPPLAGAGRRPIRKAKAR